MSQEKLVGIIGWPVTHSLSPKMHNYAFKTLGLNYRYVFLPVDTAPESLIKDAVLGLKALGFVGANVTVPHKEAILGLMDQVSDEALAIGAVNTIFIKDGKLCGHNTDAPGFICDLLDHGIDPRGLNVLILGAGGSARAVAYGLLKHGAQITILNRTESKAIELKKALSESFSADLIKCAAFDSESMRKHGQADLIVNTTSIGLLDQKATPWDEKIPFKEGQVVYDLIYKKTQLLDFAEQSGAKAINGLGMLVHQGALAFSIWTGEKAPVDIMKDGLLVS